MSSESEFTVVIGFVIKIFWQGPNKFEKRLPPIALILYGKFICFDLTMGNLHSFKVNWVKICYHLKVFDWWSHFPFGKANSSPHEMTN